MTVTNGISNALLHDLNLNAAERTNTTASPSLSTAASTTTSSAVSDGASLSGAGSLLAASSTDDVRSDKVAALKSAIDSGTYNVSASDVADKLMKTLLG